ncbi:hypothetical protein COK38_24685 [Bacillus cereus]|uniref:Uncharacterized protein n=1 Tax=Bacillus cereus TaxID=1396 RepID=A0AA44TCD4_BACCE|nr:hypothetical protein COJ55_21075 [Bacillus cereus]PFR89393.1 hypothetical protein COK38_24685 [Bacillus cereus]
MALSHAHQANILKCPQNENYIILQLFMRIQLIFLFWGASNLRKQVIPKTIKINFGSKKTQNFHFYTA